MIKRVRVQWAGKEEGGRKEAARFQSSVRLWRHMLENQGRGEGDVSQKGGWRKGCDEEMIIVRTSLVRRKSVEVIDSLGKIE